jgi:hypothetical protein
MFHLLLQSVMPGFDDCHTSIVKQAYSSCAGLQTVMFHLLLKSVIPGFDDCHTSIVKQGYSSCAGPLINPKPHVATDTAFGLLISSTSLIYNVSYVSVTIPCVSYTLQQVFMYNTYI